VAVNPEYVIVLTTLPADGEVATAFARTLVEERLAACVNVMGEMLSIYPWEGLVEEEQEVPEFIVLPITDGNDAYLRWMKDCTRPHDADGDVSGDEAR